MMPFKAILSHAPEEPETVLVLWFDGPHAIVASKDRRLHWVYVVDLRIDSLRVDMPDIFDWPTT